MVADIDLGESAMNSILIVENDQGLQQDLRQGLEENGFRVAATQDGSTALDLFHSTSPDVVLVDVDLRSTSFDGFELCRRLRKVSTVPIVFLTAREEEVDQLVGLALGADDYLVKPVSLRLLCARINLALARRDDSATPRRELVDGDLRIDIQSRKVTVQGKPVNLTRIEFDILVALATTPERVLSRDEITSLVWETWFGSEAHLDVHMSRLRKKILDAGGPRVGESVRGIGFKLR